MSRSSSKGEKDGGVEDEELTKMIVNEELDVRLKEVHEKLDTIQSEMAARQAAHEIAGGAAAGAQLSAPGGMTMDEKEEIVGDLEALTEKVEKVFTAVKVLQLTVKDLPRKNKEDDPHYLPYSNYMQSIGPPLSSKHDRSQEAITNRTGKSSRSPKVPKLNLPGQTTPNTSFAREQFG